MSGEEAMDVLEDERECDAGSRLYVLVIYDIIQTIDDNYGAERSCFDCGSYILYFPNEQTYRENISDIIS